ncbi:MAG: hypothetical protein KC621_28810, partial [Myxococcales bacterium]|nr:hypothetical protein [Myxococcales bacterium]
AEKAAAEKEAEAKAKAEADAKAKADAEAKARAEADAKAKSEAEAAAKAAQEAAAAAAAAERLRAEQEAAAKAQAEAEAKAKAAADAQEAEKARLEAERLAAEQQRLAEEQRKKEDEQRRKEEEQRAAEEASRVAQAEATQPEPAAAGASGTNGDCSDTTSLEPTALLGRLSNDQLSCLESNLQAAPKMTDKKKISLVEQANAWHKGDKVEWERLVKRHLEEIDQSDPDLCYRYAIHLSKSGASRATGVIRWSEVALENRSVWTGDTYTSRVNSLYKARAAAANTLWQTAEKDYASNNNESTRKKADDYRAMTKVYAREWYEYAKSAGKDYQTALQVCVSAAGAASYCEN